MDDLTSPTPAQSASATPAMPAPEAAAGTVQPNGEAGNGQSAPVEDGFTRMDPNTLPPQLRQFYENMNRDYKTKTQQLAEERKKYEGYDTFKQKADLYEQFATNPEFRKRWNEFVEESNRGNGQAAADPSAELKAEIAEVKHQMQVRELSEFADAFASAKDEKGELMNPDFDTLGGLQLGKNSDGDEYSLLRACVELSGGKTPQDKLTAGYKAAKQIRDQIFEEGRKHGMGKMLSKVRNATEAPTITSDKSTFSGDPKKLTVREARELAEKGLVVK